MKSLELAPGVGVVVVAHPDDETIWMGGTILASPRVRWTILCLTRSYDADRAPKFRRVCRSLNAQAIISDLEDEGMLGMRESIPNITNRLKRFLPKTQVDYLFTHNANGEYGHARHKSVHFSVRNLVKRGVIRPKQLFFFNYEPKEKSGIGVPRKVKTDVYLKLTPNLFKEKKRLIQSLYGFSSNSFESKCAGSLEPFSLAHL